MGRTISGKRNLPPQTRASSAANRSNRQRVGPIGPIVANTNDNVVVNDNENDDDEIRSMNPQLDSETLSIIQTIRSAKDVLVRLVHTNTLWLKDATNNGKYIINRSLYEEKFPKTCGKENHLRGSRTRFESSKYEANLSMSAMGVAEMLMEPKNRIDLFPTIITDAKTIHEYDNRAITGQVGPIKLVYEQMHILTSFVTPRELCFVRICVKIIEGMWLILEVTQDVLISKCPMISSPRAWRLPSGCLIKDISPGVSEVTWVEHVEIEDASNYLIYKDVILRGLAFRAERWVEILSRSCHRIGSYKNDSQNQLVCTQQTMEDDTMGQRDKEGIMSITRKMVKSFCANMTMTKKIDMPQLRGTGIFLSSCEDQETDNGVVVNATTSFWVPFSFETVLDFLRNANLRAKWDVLCNGKPGMEIANIKFGDHPDNSISMIKPFLNNVDEVILVQESLVDSLGAVVVYASLEMEDLIGELQGSLSKNVLPSGFIISKDGNPRNMHVDFRGASTSNNVVPPGINGSLVTVAFQIMSYSRRIESEFVRGVTTLITSTVNDIKLALNSPNFDE